MAWDAARPIPWKRLVRDWLLYVGVMTAIFLIVFRDRITPGLFAGLLVSGPIFLAIGAVLAKFGYQRKTLAELRAESARRAAAKSSAGSTGGAGGRAQVARPRPAPTKRTSQGRNRPAQKRRR